MKSSPLPPSFFDRALPIWPEGLDSEMNVFVGFQAEFETGDLGATLAITAASVYRIFCNGLFVGYGPARAAHGHARVDAIDLAPFLLAGVNRLSVEVAGYQVNSFYLLDELPFLQAEIRSATTMLAATDASESFQAIRLTHRRQKVQRYSFQRPFTEVYRMGPETLAWRTLSIPSEQRLPCIVRNSLKLLPRRVAYPEFTIVPAELTRTGSLESVPIAKLWKDRSTTDIGPGFAMKGFQEKELECSPSFEIQGWQSRWSESLLPDSLTLEGGECALLDLGVNLSGFIGCRLTCHSFTKLILSFDEILTEGDVDFTRMECVNLVSYDLEPGTYDLESFEPYTMRYIKSSVLEGSCAVESIFLREYVNPETGRVSFSSGDEVLQSIFRAAEETYRQNSLDTLMDCPSRERAGWLNDSIFSSQSAYFFSGNTKVETVFYENFLHAPELANVPPAMFPMCYPGDFTPDMFTPNLPCWMICQMEGYLERGGDAGLVWDLEPKVLAYLDYLGSFENAEGLVEKLPGWVFVEWSKANKWVQDINAPVNLLYADALRAAGRIYQREDLAERAVAIYQRVREYFATELFFVDNLKRIDGQLVPTGNHSEVCQYHAFLSGLATPESHPNLWDVLVKRCGPVTADPCDPSLLEPAEMIMGRYMRFDLLSRYGHGDQVVEEVRATFQPMVELTGTLWEKLLHTASCNHGLAAYSAVLLARHVSSPDRALADTAS